MSLLFHFSGQSPCRPRPYMAGRYICHQLLIVTCNNNTLSAVSWYDLFIHSPTLAHLLLVNLTYSLSPRDSKPDRFSTEGSVIWLQAVAKPFRSFILQEPFYRFDVRLLPIFRLDHF